MGRTKRAARLNLQEILAILKRWNSQVDKLMKQEGGVLVKSTSTRFDYQFPEISYLKGLEYNTDRDGHGGVGFAFLVNTKPKNYGIGDQFDLSTGRAKRSFDDPIYLWDDDAEDRFGEMLQQMRREIQKIRIYSDGLGAKRKRSVSAQQHRMAMELVGGVSRTASEWGSNITPTEQANLEKVVKLLSVSGAKVLPHKKALQGFVIDFPLHTLMRSFSCWRLRDGLPFQCAFNVHNPLDDQWSKSMIFSLSAKPTGEMAFDITKPIGGVKLLKVVREFLKKAEYAEKIYDRRGLPGLKSLHFREGLAVKFHAEEDRKREEEKETQRRIKERQEGQARDAAEFAKRGINVPTIPLFDEDGYWSQYRHSWGKRLTEIIEANGGQFASVMGTGHFLYLFPKSRFLQRITVDFGKTIPDWKKDGFAATAYILDKSDRTKQGESGWGFDAKNQEAASLHPLRVAFSDGDKGAERFERSLKRMLKDMSLVPPVPDRGDLSFVREDIRSFLQSIEFGPAGKARTVNVRGDVWDVDPIYRERLDHYGNDGDGWDDEGWQAEYSEPVYVDTVSKLEQRFDKGYFFVDVGEKGHISVSLTPKGKENIS